MHWPICNSVAALRDAGDLLKRFLRDGQGSTSTEYALIAVLLTIVLIVAVSSLADSIVNLPLSDIVAAINTQLSK